MNKKQLIGSLKQQGFSDSIINAFEKIKREDFLSKKLKYLAYKDIALPIGKKQTISQPYTIAMMISLLDLKKNQKVLEIGSGCGYVLALISQITKHFVYGIERINSLANSSIENLKDFPKIKVYSGNGQFGLKEHAPYDRILISAAIKNISKKIFLQLCDGGILVAPVGKNSNQDLIKFQKKKNRIIQLEKIPGFVFVKFINSYDF